MTTDNDKSEKPTSKKGPKPDTVTIKEQWEDAIEIALKKEKPKEGWPKQ